MTESERHEVATRAAASILGIDRSRIRLVVDGADAPAWPGEDVRAAIARWVAIEQAASDLVTAADGMLSEPTRAHRRERLKERADDLTAALNVAEPNTAWMRAFIPRPPAPDDGWRPIESAPRGEDILVGCGDVDGPGLWWQSVAWLDPDDVDPLDGFDSPPTHWHRLPAPPPSDEPGREAGG